jgi:DNA-binding HxlR family transcriptional regulator
MARSTTAPAAPAARAAPAGSAVPACPVAAALDVIGEKWTILILRDLSRNPARRFQDLIESLKGCAPNTLSARLASLEQHGLIERRLYEQHPPRMEYMLTDGGRDVLPVLTALTTWGRKLQAAAAPK